MRAVTINCEFNLPHLSISILSSYGQLTTVQKLANRMSYSGCLEAEGHQDWQQDGAQQNCG